MSDLPGPVLELLQRQAVARREPAYVRIDANARVLEAGGNLSKYGLEELERGDAVDVQVPFLQGLLRSVEADPYLLTVEADTGVVADVFLSRESAADWIVLLDATLEREQQYLIQQTTNELRLLQTRLDKGELAAGASAAMGVLAGLGMVVLECLEGIRLHVLGTPPEWLSSLWPEAATASAPIALQEFSPFLESFVQESESVWQQGEGVLRSGTWTEVDRTGKEWHLESSALVVGGRRLLVIADVGQHHDAMSGLLQRARENVLIHQALLSEIEKKDILLHSIVHDLRGPMVSAHSGLQLLETEDLSIRGRRTLDIGMKELERQDRLIRSILDVFAADVKGLQRAETTGSTADVLECARAVVESFASVYQLQDVELKLSVRDQSASSWRAVGDRMRLIRVYGNLVDNALRHSKSGSTVRLSLQAEDRAILVKVEDEGPGVPSDLTDRLFDRFTQLGSSRGTLGLGLHFCRITVEGWGGEIGYRNRPEGGACFWFRLNRADP
jgi:signal transduction histidine kinase